MANIHRRIEIWFSQFCAWIYRRKYVAIAGTLLMVILPASQIVNLKIDTRDESFFHEDDPILVAYNEFRDRFGKDDLFIIALKPRHGLNRAFFLTLYQLHHELEASVPYLDDINSLVNGRVVRGDGDTLVVEDLLKEPPATEATVNRILDLIDHYPLYESLIVSRDRSIVFILIKAQAVKDSLEDALLAGFETDLKTDDSPSKDPAPTYLSNDENREINKAIHQVVARYQDRDVDFYFSGIPVFVTELQKGIEKDISTMLPLSVLIIMIFLFLLFRRVSGVIYPLITVLMVLMIGSLGVGLMSMVANVVPIICIFGVMGIGGIPLDLATILIGSIVLGLVVDDTIHFLHHFRRAFEKTGNTETAIRMTLSSTGRALVVTSLVLSGGFFIFTAAYFANTVRFGLLTGCAVQFALVADFFLVPALLHLVYRDKRGGQLKSV